MSLQSIQEQLRRSIGLDPAAAGPGLVERAVRDRMKSLGLRAGDVEAYRRLLQESEAELRSLVDEVVVSESWFFRDLVPFETLRDRALATLSADPDRVYRILSMPCAAGEEPYSAAITLLDAGVPARQIRIVGVDLSERPLLVARRSVYSQNAFRSGDTAFLSRHFTAGLDGYRLNPAVASLVDFRCSNLLDPQVLAKEAPFDAVFCRNLLIYLDADARSRLLANVDRLLAADGILFVGHAEKLGVLGPGYLAAGPRGSFAFVREGGAQPARRSASVVTRSKTSPRRPTAPGRPPRPRPEPEPAPRTSDPGPAAVVPTTDSLMAEASRAADAGNYPEAAALCGRLIQAKGPSAPAYFLLGVVRQAAGDVAAAEVAYGKAVYLDSRHQEALLALANLARRRGDRVGEDAYRRRAERAFREEQRP